jgi:hypothetical protein
MSGRFAVPMHTEARFAPHIQSSSLSFTRLESPEIAHKFGYLGTVIEVHKFGYLGTVIEVKISDSTSDEGQE